VGGFGFEKEEGFRKKKKKKNEEMIY